MTNRELLRADDEHLTELDRQKRHVLRIELAPMPCPACHTPVNALTSAGIDIDAFDFGATKLTYRCPHCKAELVQIVPFVAIGPGWYWHLSHDWLAERLHKAREYEREHPQQAP